MFKKIFLAIACFIATIGFAFAQVDVNKADQAALDGVKHIGPSISKKIIEERKKGGDFKDWADFEKRVKGIGEKNSAAMSQAGLVVNGQPKPNAPAAPAAKETKASKASKADVAPAAAAPATASAPVATKEDKKDSKADKKAKKAEAAPAAASASASASQDDKKESKADKKKKKAEKAAASASAPAADKK
jgi:competence protein ComEA